MDEISKAASAGLKACFDLNDGEPGVNVCIAPELDGAPIALVLFITDPDKIAAIKAAWDAIDPA